MIIYCLDDSDSWWLTWTLNLNEDKFNIAMYLITHGYYLSCLGIGTLTYASRMGKLDVVKKLIEEYKIDPNGET